MILWPAATSLILVWAVFRDPAFDHRMVMAGAVLPDVVDGLVSGGAGFLHTLLASVVLLAAVMVGTRGRRPARRRLLALPIGTFAHLIFDGAWARAEAFWWPLFGGDLDGPLPALERGLPLLAAQEVAGLAVLGWFWWRFGLSQADARRVFLRTGRVARSQV